MKKASGQNTRKSTGGNRRGNPANLRPPWPKGKSGNPGGRPKVDPDFIELCATGSKSAAEELVRRLVDPKLVKRIPTQDLARVVVVMGDRKYGKPVQPLAGQLTGNVTIVVKDAYWEARNGNGAQQANGHANGHARISVEDEVHGR